MTIAHDSIIIIIDTSSAHIISHLKGGYTMQSKAHMQANDKYNKANYDSILTRIPKGTKVALQNYLFAERDNISLNAFIVKLIETDIKQKLTDL